MISRAHLPLTQIGSRASWAISLLALVVVLAGYVSGALVVFALLLLAVAVLAFIDTAAVVAVVPAVAGLTYHPLHAGSLEFSPAETLIVGLLLGWGSRLALDSVRAPRRVVASGRRWIGAALHGRFVLPAALVLLAGIVSLFTLARPEYRHESLRQFRWVILEPVAYYLIARTAFTRRDLTARAAAFFVAGGVFIAATGLADLATGGGVMTEGVRRIAGLYPHPNALALYLERPLAFAAVLALAYRRRVSVGLLVLAAVIGVALLLTFSRGAALATAVAVIAAVALAGRARLAGLLTAGAALVGVAAAITARDRVLNLFSGGSGSLRLDLWQSALAMLRDHPLSGIGLDQFLYSYAPRYIHARAWPERFTSHPHDIILDLWLSLGILGIIAGAVYLAVFIVCARRALRLRRPLGLASAALLAAGALHGLVDNGYFLPDLALMFWFATALLEAETATDVQAVRDGGT